MAKMAKIVIVCVDGAPTPSVRSLAAVNVQEDILVLLHTRGATRAKNVVKQLAGLPPGRVVEAEIGGNATTPVERVFDFLATAKVPQTTEILVLPTTGWAMPFWWGGGESLEPREGQFARSAGPAPALGVNRPSPIFPAMVTMAVIEVANARRLPHPQIIATTGDSLLWQVGGRHLPAPLSVNQWSVILGHRPMAMAMHPFSDFFVETSLSPSWGEWSKSRKTGIVFASGLSEVNGRAFFVIATNTPPAELKLRVIEEILKLKNKGGEMPILVLAECRDMEGLETWIKSMTMTQSMVIDMGEDPIFSPTQRWETFSEWYWL